MNEKIPCKRCGAMILESTARATNGVCMPCKIGFRELPPKTKFERSRRNAYKIAAGSIATIFIVIVLIVTGLVKSPRSGNLFYIATASTAENYYFDKSFDFIEGNNRFVVSIRSGKVDFIVFTANDKEDYPKYAGIAIGENKVVGHIMRSSYNDRINITNSRKAYEIRDQEIVESPIDIEISAHDIPKLAKLLGTEFTISKLNQIKDKILE